MLPDSDPALKWEVSDESRKTEKVCVNLSIHFSYTEAYRYIQSARFNVRDLPANSAAVKFKVVICSMINGYL